MSSVDEQRKLRKLHAARTAQQHVACHGLIVLHACGRCIRCQVLISTVSDKLCRTCAGETEACTRCGKPLREGPV